jgi:hypothetical protein
MTTKTPSPAAQEVIDRVRALREYTKTTGFRTTRTQNDLIQAINDPNDFATVVLALKSQQ